MTSTSPATPPRALGLAFVLTLVLGLALVLPSGAFAAAPSGVPVATFPVGKKGKGLRTKGVRVTATGRAKIYQTWAGLPVSDVSVGAHRDATLILGGGLKLKKGRRSVSIRGLLVRVKGRTVTITGKVGKRRTTVFSGHASPSPKLDGSLQSVELTVKKLVLTTKAAKLVRKSIHSFPSRHVTLGRFEAKAYVTSPNVGGPTVDPSAAAVCAPTTGPSSDLAKPVGATNLSCASLVWNLRSSWVGYVDQTVGVAPASGLAAIAESNHVCPDGSNFNKFTTFSYLLPSASGWWDATSGTGELATNGGFRFTGAPAAGIEYDIQLTDVELKFNGASSELWGNLWDRTSTHTEFHGPMHFANFDATQSLSGGPVAPGKPPVRVRLKLTAAGAAPFDGNYPAGDGFGCIDVGFNF